MNEPAPLWKLKLKSLLSHVSSAVLNEFQHTGALLTEIAKTAYTNRTKDISDTSLAEILRQHYGAKNNKDLLSKLGVSHEAQEIVRDRQDNL